MSSLEDPDETDTRTATVAAGDREVEVAIPDDASADEAAAIVSAVGAHVADRERAAAAAAAAAERDSTEYADEWVLAGRLERFGKRRRPANVERGEEWAAAGRSFY